jgi:hypothetical protein
MSRNIFATTVLALAAAAAVAFAQPQPKTFFKTKIQLADADIQKIDQGQVVTKVVDSGDPKYGILVFGAVYVNAPVAKFGTVIRDINRLTENKVYLAVQEFSTNGAAPKPSDFARLTLDNKDIDELQDCKAGDCDIQIFNVEQFQKQINWKAGDKYPQANKLVRERLYQGMDAYLKGGLKSIGNYRDREKPLNLYTATKGMIDASYFLPQDKAGAIYREVLDYPQAKVPGAGDLFYWEKIDFGQEPTVRVSHLMLFPQGAGAVKFIAANLQLYASRYMRVALQMYYCVPDTSNPQKPGFYLIEMNDSQMPDFGGLKLGIVRKVASSKATDATRDSLTMYQKMLLGK